MLNINISQPLKTESRITGSPVRFKGSAWDDDKFRTLIPDLFPDPDPDLSNSGTSISDLIKTNKNKKSPGARQGRTPRDSRQPRGGSSLKDGSRLGGNDPDSDKSRKLSFANIKKWGIRGIGALLVLGVGGVAANQVINGGDDGSVDRKISSDWSNEVQAAHQPVKALLAQQTEANINPDLIKQMLLADIEALKVTVERQYQLRQLLDKPEAERTALETATITAYQNAKLEPISQNERDDHLRNLEAQKGSVDSKTQEIATKLAEDVQRRYSYAIEQAHLSPVDSTALLWAIIIDPATRAKFGGLEAMIGKKSDDSIFLPLLDKYSIALVENGGTQDLALATVYAGRALVQQHNGVPELTVVHDFIKRFTEARTLLSSVVNDEAKKQLSDDNPALSDMAFRMVAMMGTPQVQQNSFFLENESWTNELMENLAGFYEEDGVAPSMDPSLLDPAALIPASALNTDSPYNFTALLEDLKALNSSAPENATVADFLVATEFDNKFPDVEALSTSENPEEVRNYYKAQAYKNRVGVKVKEAVDALTLQENPLEKVVKPTK